MNKDDSWSESGGRKADRRKSTDIKPLRNSRGSAIFTRRSSESLFLYGFDHRTLEYAQQHDTKSEDKEASAQRGGRFRLG